MQRHPCQAGYPEEASRAAHRLGGKWDPLQGPRPGKLEPRMILLVPTGSLLLLFSVAWGGRATKMCQRATKRKGRWRASGSQLSWCLQAPKRLPISSPAVKRSSPCTWASHGAELSWPSTVSEPPEPEALACYPCGPGAVAVVWAADRATSDVCLCPPVVLRAIPRYLCAAGREKKPFPSGTINIPSGEAWCVACLPADHWLPQGYQCDAVGHWSLCLTLLSW